jgi:hypothetical protein
VATKVRLSFCKLTKNGDDEGCWWLFNLPTPERQTSSATFLPIQKRWAVSAAELERLKAFAFTRKPRKEASLEKNIGVGD